MAAASTGRAVVAVVGVARLGLGVCDIGRGVVRPSPQPLVAEMAVVDNHGKLGLGVLVEASWDSTYYYLQLTPTPTLPGRVTHAEMFTSRPQNVLSRGDVTLTNLEYFVSGGGAGNSGTF